MSLVLETVPTGTMNYLAVIQNNFDLLKNFVNNLVEAGFFEADGSGDLMPYPETIFMSDDNMDIMPVADPPASDGAFELDGNSDIMPLA